MKAYYWKLGLVLCILFLPMSLHTSAQDEPLVLADFESEISYAQDEYGNDIGFVPWGDQAGNVILEVVEANADLAVPDQADENSILSVTYDIDTFGGFTHVLTDGTDWIPQDWSAYSALDFWIRGANTDRAIQVEIFDNRAENSTTDTAERWFYRINDDFDDWQHFSIPFDSFQRRYDWQPGGAPNDGLGLAEVHGYAFTFPAGTGQQTIYIDDVALSNSAPHVVPTETATPAETSHRIGSDSDTDTYNFDGDWELIWNDEFDADAGSPVNADYWTCQLGGHGWGNNEWEFYTDRPENVTHSGDGYLIITAREEEYQGNAYTSARCNTMDKVEFAFGRIEARIDLPNGQGIWPAFWMLGADYPEVDWPESGEIDIMEYYGQDSRSILGTLHGPGYSGGGGLSARYIFDEPAAIDYHIYGVEWEPEVIRWYVDGELYFTLTPQSLYKKEWIFDKDFFLLINIAVGGNLPGYPDDTTVFPQEMLIDWIRVYQRNP